MKKLEIETKQHMCVKFSLYVQKFSVSQLSTSLKKLMSNRKLVRMTSKYANNWIFRRFSYLRSERIEAVTYESIQGTEDTALAFASKRPRKWRDKDEPLDSIAEDHERAMELFKSADEDDSGDLDAYEAANVSDWVPIWG